MHYRIYGLHLESNQVLPGLAVQDEIPVPDVRVSLRAVPEQLRVPQGAELWYESQVRDAQNEPTLKVWKIGGGEQFRLCYCDGTEFVIDRQGTEIQATWLAPLTIEDTATYLLGPVLGFLLRLRGISCLHASAINVSGQALVLLGPAGAGKSTTAAAFAQCGYKVLSEDVVALYDIDETVLVQPGYPLIRLWPSSAQSLFGAPNALPPLTPNWDKCGLALGQCFQATPLPLAAIYILGGRRDDQVAPFIETVSTQTGLMSLIENTYTNYLLDQAMRAREFELLGRLVLQAPLRQITPHTEITRLPELCRAIVADFYELGGKSHERS